MVRVRKAAERMTRILGAILAGGASRRFGSDKLLAQIDGKPLIEHVVSRLTGQVSDIVILGRSYNNLPVLKDKPTSGLGPLGGLNAALHHARAHRFDAVLLVPGDAPDLPLNLAERLNPMPAYLVDSPVTGLWPTHLTSELNSWLAADKKRAVTAFGDYVGAHGIKSTQPMANINTPQDYEDYCQR